MENPFCKAPTVDWSALISSPVQLAAHVARPLFPKIASLSVLCSHPEVASLLPWELTVLLGVTSKGDKGPVAKPWGYFSLMWGQLGSQLCSLYQRKLPENNGLALIEVQRDRESGWQGILVKQEAHQKQPGPLPDSHSTASFPAQCLSTGLEPKLSSHLSAPENEVESSPNADAHHPASETDRQTHPSIIAFLVYLLLGLMLIHDLHCSIKKEKEKILVEVPLSPQVTRLVLTPPPAARRE